ncbi:MAG TPA: bifunctional diaminohydroxyphosphoribosylaminopyrimidine deaminase/5-amino-6-(5-phosphoribosylamino)uracil reductase RibD, partial [Chitinophagaceae bacterium]|nr:bifunctional diaminohydroxyphosphoribosylaminopyrimidine deaminase/5-amino-6-(5-phosphoribosylamino)uracil reductase RibD [Chitinophagaceae bacterium]
MQRLEINQTYMHRCIQLASLAAGHVAPNPMVGAVLVHNNRIIGEGYHEVYGQPHAEVNCINSVKEEDRSLIPHSTLYVSLEPCSHFGKTPPCADLIIKHNIHKVVVGCLDPFPEVSGRGIAAMKAAGIEVITGVLEQECRELNKRFLLVQSQHRPYIILKWAQSSNGRMARADLARFAISNEYSRRLVHKWRSEEASILVGTNTAFFDDPELTNRYWHGAQPVRLIIDMELRLPSSLKLFNREVRTIIFNRLRHEEDGNLVHYQVTNDVSLVHQVVHALYHLRIQSVLVEGGARLLQSFID